MNKEDKTITLSTLNHSWFIDIDGTICKHNGYKIDGHDTLLPGTKEFFEHIPTDDMIVIVTSRTDEYKDETIKFLNENNIRYNQIIFNCPYGERIIINDDKPSGLHCGMAINLKRDEGLSLKIVEDEKL